MLYKELYKVFMKQKGLLFILALLFLKIVFVIYNGYDSHYMIDENETYYLNYLHQYGGRITEQKEKKIEAEYDDIYHKKNKSLAASQKEKAFQVIYHQYLYEKEKGGGAILDTRGWQSILEHDDLDFFLILCIVIISCMFFCTEYESKMYVLLLSGKRGKYHATGTKILLGTVISAALSLLFQMVHIFYLNAAVGLEHGDCLLKSLEMFEGTRYDISLKSAVVLIVSMRTFGGMFLSAMSMLLAVLLKKTSFSIVMGFIFILIPELLFSEGAFGYYIPLPLGVLRACGYLYPNLYASAITDQGLEKQCIFHEIPQSAFMGFQVVFMIMFCLACFLCFMIFSKAYGRIAMIKKSACCFLIVFCAAFVLNGCGLTQRRNESTKFWIDDADTFQDECSFEEGTITIDDNNNAIIYTDGEGKEMNLIRDVFPLRLTVHNIYVDGRDCYYVMENDNDSGICVRKVNMDDFSDVLVFNSIEENIEDFYGLRTKHRDEKNIFEDTEETKWFFVSGRYIYLKKKYCIRQINRKNGSQRIVAESVSDGKVRYDNGKLFYLDANGKQAVYQEE